MIKFFIPKLIACIGDSLTMDGDNARHAITVLRLNVNDKIIVCDGDGTDYLCEIIKTGRESVNLTVLSSEPSKSEPHATVYLFASLLKGDKTDLVIQKSVEIGVSSIYLMVTENCVVKSITVDKLARLNKIAEAAAKQSGRGVIPTVHLAGNLNNVLFATTKNTKTANLHDFILLAGHEKNDSSLKKILGNYTQIQKAAIFIGPEGGFSPAEIALLEKNNATLFSLGKRVLRAETAAIAALAAIFYEVEG
ncbi:MAG: 16S rRNA (uracil(1498)-N(3))-methyltransferase [Defluviitaleaceae bacterium]|nr:16S rRNA (uracil(1498)-N(3))-methyltransferase [Defluviitaleaceae bacterium]